MFKKVLIANRGEIALRIIRALRELHIASVAVFSQADQDALHVKFADEAVCIGPASSTLSYLNIPAIISAAEITSADAIHPGYGFLAENAEFAEVCNRCGLTWIGPQPDLMKLMGDKVRARAAMIDAGVPVLPGSKVLQSKSHLIASANDIGFPVILKAVAGGGGRGMKIVESGDTLVKDWQRGQTEAKLAFGNPDMYMERYCRNPRHIEVQVIGDTMGNAVHLGERECSVQRRHQKILEEAPSEQLSPALREQFHKAATDATKRIGYQGVGTLEFLLDEDDQFYFMEMNTRLQVEHPVTEMVTGVDLVREQIKIAAGVGLSPAVQAFSKQGPRGHSIELRINAEDSLTFAPSPGKITGLNLPGGLGVRVDTHIYEGYVVPSHYDSLLAKLIVHDTNRGAAIHRALRCLDEFVIEGISTNINFHKTILNHPDFRAGRVTTGFVAQLLAERETGLPSTVS